MNFSDATYISFLAFYVAWQVWAYWTMWEAVRGKNKDKE